MYWGETNSAERSARAGGKRVALTGGLLVLIVGALILTAVGAFAAGYYAARPVDQDALRVFDEVWALVERDFYYPLPEDKDRAYGAIQGMLATLNDPHTLFLPPVAAARDTAVMQGQMGGVGAVVSQNEAGEAFVVEVRRGWPAEQAGVRVGDVILKVNGEDVAGKTLDQTVALIRGLLGEEVTLTLRREGTAQPFDLSMERGQINVYGTMLEDGIAYLSMDLFNSTAPADVRAALERLLPENPRALVLDLRNNGGGFLDESLEIADLFLPDGPIATEKLTSGEQRQFVAHSGDIAERIPLVVLVNGRSASASEIVAGAIQDRGRGILVGQRTFGKGSVQVLHTLGDGSQLRVTQGAWYTPDQTPIERRGDEPGGLLPDIVVEIPTERTPGVDPELEAARDYIRLSQSF
ncbi:MAG: S41 family peptidase [Anaerolineae bacterium]|nr:S41 family peptidase [Anaerolineae bacterium]